MVPAAAFVAIASTIQGESEGQGSTHAPQQLANRIEQTRTAVISEFIIAPKYVPCSHDSDWYTSGTVSGRRPPKMMASIGTPATQKAYRTRIVISVWATSSGQVGES